MYQRIVVPLDGSDAAEIVLPYAAEFANKLGSEIILVSVSESSTGLDHLYRSYLEHVREQIEGHLDEHRAVGKTRVLSKVLLGKLADEIWRYVSESHANLVIIAGRSSVEGPWPLGSVAAKVLRAIDVPVLLIKAGAKRDVSKQPTLVNRILLPLDGSKLGEAAIPDAEMLAQSLPAELVLLHVVDPLIAQPIFEPVMSYTLLVPQNEEANRADAIVYLNGVGERLREKGVNTSSDIIFGSPADQIAEYAAKSRIGLIAMSTHGRSGISRWVFGSVTDKVLHAGNTPALVVRPPKT